MATSSSPLPLYVKRRKVVVVVIDNHGRHLLPRRYSSISRKGKGAITAATPPITQLMRYGIPVVVALLILQYQLPAGPAPARAGPFQENPAAYLCFVAATCAYWLVVEATKRNKKLYRKLGLALGMLSSLSLISLFLSYPISLLPLLTWMPLALLLTWPKPYRWIVRVVIAKIQKDMAVRERGGGGEEPVLPV